jgi:hypothetical protein
MTTLDAYVRHARTFGLDGIRESLPSDEFEQVVRALMRNPGKAEHLPMLRCDGPGCFVVFEPRRKGQCFCSPACRQRCHRVRNGTEHRVRSV